MSRFTMFGQMPDPVLPPENLNPSFDQRARMVEAILPSIFKFMERVPANLTETADEVARQLAERAVQVADIVWAELKRTHPKA